MKKQILITIMSVSSILTLNAQWNGTSILTTNASVGIGTDSPKAKLDVNLTATSTTITKISDYGPSGRINLYNTGNNNTKVAITYDGQGGGGAALEFGRGTDWDTYMAFYTQIGLGLSGRIYERMRIDPSGNIGIGTSSPKAKLDVNLTATSTTITKISDYGPSGRINLYNTGNNNTKVAITYDGQGGGGAALEFGRGTEWNTYMAFYTQTGIDGASGRIYERMRIDPSGNIGIGTSTPNSAYKLDVNGTIHAKEIVVDTNFPLADFVFDPSYKLMPLHEVEAFVNENKHLPEIPSAKEVDAKGLNIGEMQNKLLQKVEELTLYVIEQQKLLAGQQAQIEELKKLVSNNQLAIK